MALSQLALPKDYENEDKFIDIRWTWMSVRNKCFLGTILNIWEFTLLQPNSICLIQSRILDMIPTYPQIHEITLMKLLSNTWSSVEKLILLLYRQLRIGNSVME